MEAICSYNLIGLLARSGDFITLLNPALCTNGQDMIVGTKLE